MVSVSTPFEKYYIVKLGSSSPHFRVENKKYLKPLTQNPASLQKGEGRPSSCCPNVWVVPNWGENTFHELWEEEYVENQGVGENHWRWRWCSMMNLPNLKGNPQQKTSWKITLDFHSQRNSRKPSFFNKGIPVYPSLKLTVRPCKLMVGRVVSFLKDAIFSKCELNC